MKTINSNSLLRALLVLIALAAHQSQIQALASTPSLSQETPISTVVMPEINCPVDWSALSDIDGPNLDRVIWGVKARDWRKEYIETALAKTQKCIQASNDPESVKRAVLVDIQTRSYPNAVVAIDRRDQRLRQEEQRAQMAAQQKSINEQSQAEQAVNTTPTDAESTIKQRQVDFERQKALNAENAAIDRAAQSRKDSLLTILFVVAAALAGWYWNKFIRNRCPKCRSTSYDTISVDEIDRWRGTKKVTEQHSRGSRTRHVSTTYAKNLYSYRCRDCQTEWTVEKKEEL